MAERAEGLSGGQDAVTEARMMRDSESGGILCGRGEQG